LLAGFYLLCAGYRPGHKFHLADPVTHGVGLEFGGRGQFLFVALGDLFGDVGEVDISDGADDADCHEQDHQKPGGVPSTDDRWYEFSEHVWGSGCGRGMDADLSTSSASVRAVDCLVF
jgi:hypothetical protein